MKQGMTTQKAEATVSNVIKKTDSVVYDVNLALKFIRNQVRLHANVLSDLDTQPYFIMISVFAD